MAKSEWGVKRVCQSCAAKFYDLNRSPITCPKCAASFDPEALLKSRRSRPAPAAKIAKPEKAVSAAGAATGAAAGAAAGAATGAATGAAKSPVEDDAKLDDDAESVEAGGRSDHDDDDDSVLQDTSDLGDDGVSEVVVTSDDEDT